MTTPIGAGPGPANQADYSVGDAIARAAETVAGAVAKTPGASAGDAIARAAESAGGAKAATTSSADAVTLDGIVQTVATGVGAVAGHLKATGDSMLGRADGPRFPTAEENGKFITSPGDAKSKINQLTKEDAGLRNLTGQLQANGLLDKPTQEKIESRRGEIGVMIREIDRRGREEVDKAADLKFPSRDEVRRFIESPGDWRGKVQELTAEISSLDKKKGELHNKGGLAPQTSERIDARQNEIGIMMKEIEARGREEVDKAANLKFPTAEENRRFIEAPGDPIAKITKLGEEERGLSKLAGDLHAKGGYAPHTRDAISRRENEIGRMVSEIEARRGEDVDKAANIKFPTAEEDRKFIEAPGDPLAKILKLGEEARGLSKLAGDLQAKGGYTRQTREMIGNRESEISRMVSELEARRRAAE